MKKSILLALAAILLLSGVALAVAYIHGQEVNVSVTLVSGTQGIEVVPTTFTYGDVAIGEWSDPKPVRIKNLTATETWTTLYVESAAPVGLGLYLNIAPFTPVPPGGEVMATLLIRSEANFAAGPYSFKAKVIGQK